MDEDFWNTRYRESERIWSGAPNVQLVAEATGLRAGDALDAGCGEGADALWLAGRGWTVTAVDFAQVALDKGEAEGLGQGLGERITWICEDLVAWKPAAEFSLVSAQFFHLPPTSRESALRNLAGAVVTGGSLLVVGHGRSDLAMPSGRLRHAEVLFDPRDIEEILEPTDWHIAVSESRRRTVDGPDGEPFTHTDTVVRAVRLG